MKKCKWFDASKEVLGSSINQIKNESSKKASKECEKDIVAIVVRSILTRARQSFLYRDDIKYASKNYKLVLIALRKRKIITRVNYGRGDMYILNYLNLMKLFGFNIGSKLNLFFSLVFLRYQKINWIGYEKND